MIDPEIVSDRSRHNAESVFGSGGASIGGAERKRTDSPFRNRVACADSTAGRSIASAALLSA
jgi:hypothetical protein